MRVTVLASSNQNEKYLDCVPHFIDFWLGHNAASAHDFTPMVIIIGSDLPKSLERYSTYCRLYNPPFGVSSVFSSQIIRVLYPAICETDVVLTTDIDMVPLSSREIDFVLSGRDKHDSSFEVVRDVLPEGQYPICYNIATPQTWSDVTGVRSLSDVDKVLAKEFLALSDANSDYDGERGSDGWYTDQEYLFRVVESFERLGGLVRRFRDSETGHKRLDRLGPYFLSWVSIPLVILGVFTDHHLRHPVKRYPLFMSALKLAAKFSFNRLREK